MNARTEMRPPTFKAYLFKNGMELVIWSQAKVSNMSDVPDLEI